MTPIEPVRVYTRSELRRHEIICKALGWIEGLAGGILITLVGDIVYRLWIR